MNYVYDLADRKTGAEKFVDHLMAIYDDSMRTSNPSWHAGKQMFEKRWDYKNKDITGFKKELI